ncbi:AAA-like domain-containing protein [Arthrospira platensis NCB002]|mgnify:CR=1 FL=1|uniref:WD-40 repeat protein n=1 Tax=Limnospira platensis NIES-46 TaxID=1236695 RepID=A0A5M3T2W9_LIMPL|nr:AAA-like domain-containing protein [Arthrospira platensis]MDF2209677.1 AAA-like domain-containing protein [Arthrospira platensis NCB002]BAI90436.1 WD-40 repeat protein [Arthrospira platensis NIES-39]BDT12739.1 WD-40 repeat protein [Arthrospira platensis NIES-39]GCE92932.1 WD-40 repeat protein [Arthrospira platensis NIES-46]
MITEYRSIYQVGGSLHTDCPSYVKRQADTDLYEALKRGEFGYVLNSRQMGKSSLLVQTRHRLQAEGIRCATLDMTVIGSEDVTPMQWYKGIFVELWRGFGLLKSMPFKVWWKEQGELSLVQKLNQFLVEVLLPTFPHDIFCIFIDEIDTILSLPFPVDDWFAFIRFCYNQRATEAAYQRLNFAIFGVANPSDLIRDRTRTPFNIGTAIALSGFTLEEAKPLQKGLNVPGFNGEILLQEILNWTGGQPFLTQKLCNLIYYQYHQDINPLNRGQIASEKEFIKTLVIDQIITNWEKQDEPEHLRTIRNRIISNPQICSRLLGIYQKILLETEIPFDGSREETEVLLSGLIEKSGSVLKVKNPIYEHIFNLEWTQKQLNLLRPYSQNFEAWIASCQTDDSRLLRGQALLEARNWALGKSLSDGDYQFLSASEKCDRAAMQQALEAEKLIAVEARLLEEYKNSRLQRRLLTTVVLSLLFSLGLAGLAYSQYRRAIASYEITKVREIEALISATEGQFLSQNSFNALINAVRAKMRIKDVKNPDYNIQNKVNSVLIQSVYGMNEYHSFGRQEDRVWSLDWSKDGEQIAIITRTNSQDVDRRDKIITDNNQILIFNRRGKLLNIIPNFAYELRTLAFFPDGYIATGHSNGEIRIWSNQGDLVFTFSAHEEEIWDLIIRDQDTIATSSNRGSIKLWRRDGTLLNEFVGHTQLVKKIAFSPDGNRLASVSDDGTVKLWDITGELLADFEHSQEPVEALAFSPDGQYLVAGGHNRELKLWSINERSAIVLGKHDNSIRTVAFSPDGNIIASGSWDQTIRLWSPDGRHLQTFVSHTAPLTQLAFSPDGETLASADFNGEVKLWKVKSPFLTVLSGHETHLRRVALTPDHQQVFSVSWGGEVYRWDMQGRLLGRLEGHDKGVIGLGVSPDGEIVATGSWDESIRLWNMEGELLKVINNAHSMGVNQLAFSPNGEVIASVGNDKKVKLWSRVGEFIREWEYSEVITGVAFSPDGKMVVTGSEDKEVRVVYIDGSGTRLIGNHQGSVWGVAFSPQGDIIASASTDNTVRLWFLDGRKSIVLHHQGIVDHVAFSPDGEMIASASWDGTIQLWTNEGVKLKTLIRHQGPARTVAFSNDGKWIISGGDDHKGIIWNVAEIMALDELSYACYVIQDYLNYHPGLKDEERNLCDRFN